MADINVMIDAVRDYLDKEDWKYEYDAGRGIIRTGVSLKCKLQAIRIFFTFSEEGFSVIATINMKADEQYRAVIAEYITRANYGLKSGNFEMDYNDGEVRYKMFANCCGLNAIPDELIAYELIVPISMFNRYGDGLAALMFGFSDPETEVKKAEQR